MQLGRSRDCTSGSLSAVFSKLSGFRCEQGFTARRPCSCFILNRADLSPSSCVSVLYRLSGERCVCEWLRSGMEAKILPDVCKNTFTQDLHYYRLVPNSQELRVCKTIASLSQLLASYLTSFPVKVTPGVHNLGIFINLHKRGDESYRLTHPAVKLGGILRGAWRYPLQ